MAHGKPDWNLTTGELTTFQLLDVGESAVRQGSIVSFDRRGDVIVMDDFEAALLKWQTSTSGAGASVALSTLEARSGGQSVRLTGGVSSNRSALVNKHVPFPVLTRFGFEFSFAPLTTIESLECEVSIFDGTNRTTFMIRWFDADQELRYRNSSGGDTVLATGVDYPVIPQFFQTWKLFVDGVAGEYVRFITNSTVISMSGIGGRVTADTNPAALRCTLRVDSRSGSNDVVACDDAIVTQNEP